LSACDAATPAAELCDGLDNNCDGTVDEGTSGQACEIKNEFGVCSGVKACSAGQAGCIGAAPTKEQCDGLDNDCNGLVDDELETGQTCVITNQFGSCSGQITCDGLAGNVCTGEAATAEVCDGKDNNCNALIDEGFVDTDGDLLSDCVDLDDDNDSIPDINDNCPKVANGSQENFDGDAFGDACDNDADNDNATKAVDCNDFDPLNVPGAVELCDGVDNNCNLQIDEGFPDLDSDGLADCIDPDDDGDNDPDSQDCEPADAAIHHAAAEVCDGIDNNCDGVIDEGALDTDADGIPDCIDGDDDNDGLADALDCKPLDSQVPSCQAKQCGSDGCGGSCGGCSGNTTCKGNQCVCVPNCNAKQCGSDGCGGSCGGCSGNTTCKGNQCVCVPSCSNKECGSDGCGGSCGLCFGNENCQNNACVCIPNCGGKQCGPDGCGGSCGGCSGNNSCKGNQCVCVPNCDGKQCGSNGCGGICGGCGKNFQCKSGECECGPSPHFKMVAGNCLPSCGQLLFKNGLKDNGMGCCNTSCKGAQAGGVGSTWDCKFCCAGPPGCGM
jgi:hypothetical protein